MLILPEQKTDNTYALVAFGINRKGVVIETDNSEILADIQGNYPVSLKTVDGERMPELPGLYRWEGSSRLVDDEWVHEGRFMATEAGQEATREARIKALLEDIFSLPSIGKMTGYQRFEDDSAKGRLNVMIGPDMDTWLEVTPDPDDFNRAARFREPIAGGGQSPRVRNALLMLAYAIQLDNEAHPQHRGK